MNTHEVAIVGAGPIGLELAVALKRRGISYVQFDAGQVGHTISWWAPQTRWFSSNERIAIAGVPLVTPDGGKATREQYLAYLRSVVQQFDLHVRTYEKVTSIRPSDGGFEIVSGSVLPSGEHRNTVRVRRIVLATGGTDRPNRLGIPGEDLPHVSHYFQDPHAYFRRRLLIVGGKNSAVEAALRSHHAGARVTLSYRQARLPVKSIKYWLLPEMQSLLDSGKIEGLLETQPVSITAEAVHLRLADGSIRVCPADFVLLLTGYVADMSLFRLAGVRLQDENERPEFNEQTMETSVPGIYVAGTAAAGTQTRYALFLENCHEHVTRIVAHLTGVSAVENQAESFALPES
jgi:thioredoxin reductase (NADPH)